MKKTGLVLVVIGSIFFGFTEGRGAEWKTFGTTGYGSYWYDVMSVTRSSKGIVRVWTKTTYTDEGRMRWVAKFGEKYMTLDYFLDLTEIHCTDKKSRSLSATFYSKDGDVLESKEYGDDSWESIVPNSISEGLHEAVCK